MRREEALKKAAESTCPRSMNNPNGPLNCTTERCPYFGLLDGGAWLAMMGAPYKEDYYYWQCGGPK